MSFVWPSALLAGGTAWLRKPSQKTSTRLCCNDLQVLMLCESLTTTHGLIEGAQGSPASRSCNPPGPLLNNKGATCGQNPFEARIHIDKPISTLAFCNAWKMAVATSDLPGFLSGCHFRKSDLKAFCCRDGCNALSSYKLRHATCKAADAPSTEAQDATAAALGCEEKTPAEPPLVLPAFERFGGGVADPRPDGWLEPPGVQKQPEAAGALVGDCRPPRAVPASS